MDALRYVTAAEVAATSTPVGYTCQGADGEELGTVAGVVVAPPADTPRFLVLETGGWFRKHTYVLPVEQVASQNDAQRQVVLRDVDKATLEAGRFPAFDEGWWAAQEQAAQAPQPTVGQATEVQLLGERLRANAKPELLGTVRLSKRVVERQETLTVPLREEYLVIEHAAGEGVVRVGDRELRPGETVEIQVLGERAVVSKEVVVREAVTVSKTALERSETVQDTVRQEELVVEQGAEFLADPQARLGREGPSPATPAERPVSQQRGG